MMIGNGAVLKGDGQDEQRVDVSRTVPAEYDKAVAVQMLQPFWASFGVCLPSFLYESTQLHPGQ